jgi:hypothetical protein
VPPSFTFGDIAAMQAPIQRAVLTFHGHGINHVIFMAQGFSAAYFLVEAQGQNYTPRYGLTSNELGPLAEVAPKQQLAGAIGVGWAPGDDLANPPEAAARKECDGVMKAEGLPTGPQAWQQCDHVAMLVRMVEAPGSLDRNAIVANLPRIGVVNPGIVGQVHYEGQRRDGVSQAQPIAYISNCSCFRYTGPAYHIN